MVQPIEMKASERARAGKGAARAARRGGHVPGVIYGDKQPPQPINLPFKELSLQIIKGGFLSKVFEIDLGGSKTRVIPRDVQLDPVKDTPIHVDFQRIGKDGIIRVAVPVRFTNEAASPGLKRGGVLNIVRHTVEVRCPADQIPDAIVVDLTGYEIGNSIHISAVKLPDNVKPTITSRDFTVATIAGAKAEEEEKPAEAAAVEGAEGAPAEGAEAAAAAAKPGEAAKGDDKGGDKGKAGDKAAGAKDDKKK